MFGDRAIGARVVPVGTQRVLGHNGGGAGLISTRKETEFGEVAGRPAGQLSEPLDAGPDRASASDRLVSKAPSAPRRRGRAHPASRERCPAARRLDSDTPAQRSAWAPKAESGLSLQAAAERRGQAQSLEHPGWLGGVPECDLRKLGEEG
jgi:hypothetical protein